MATSPAGGQATASGLHLFARYAYPPNERGYCGPSDHQALLEYGAHGLADPGLAELARSFTGPLPYLRLLAGAAGTRDPFDYRAVEAYWIGNDLLRRVGTSEFGNALSDRFRQLTGAGWNHLAEAVPAGGVCHHSFHVFHVYPWTRLLGTASGGEQALAVLDRCRIRWGQVVAATGGEAVVRCRALEWDGSRLHLGAAAAETVRCTTQGLGFVDDLQPGEWVALHWDWVCDRLTDRQLGNLRSWTDHQLRVINERLPVAGPRAALG